MRQIGSTCWFCWWTIAILAGVGAYWKAHEATTVLAALMLGAALAIFIGLAMTRFFCIGPRSNAAGLGAEKPTQAPADTASIAAEAAKTAAAYTPAAAKSDAPKAAEPSAPSAAPATPEPTTPDYDGDGTAEGENEGTRPEALTAARDGKSDNLKEIKGIGPKLEALCNSLGFYHFDQIAGWSADEVAWVNANLEGFSGRVTRDKWVEQAKILAAGGDTEFSKRVEDGDVY